MRADISPLIRARNALAASEQAERHGDMDEAIVQAQSAVSFSDVWLDELYRVTPEKCVHGIALDRECDYCAAMPQKHGA
tara:strand:+ start:3007 stop:3243 length:237 start_codon:yes stop_codon:yes gene_type:complete